MRAEFEAFKARLEASPVLAGKVSPIVRRDKNGIVRANYVVVVSSGPDEIDANRWTMVSTAFSDSRFTWDVRVVAVDADGLNRLTDAVLEQLVGAALLVDGRVCSPIIHVPNVERNDGFDQSVELFYRVMSFRFWSRPGVTVVSTSPLDPSDPSNGDVEAWLRAHPEVEGVTFTQSSPSASWVFPHSFHRVPDVTVYVDGVMRLAEVIATTSMVSISFPAPTAGIAVLS